MVKEDNQFNNFWENINSTNKNVDSYKIGTVISIDPLLIKINNKIQLDRNDMLMNTTLTSFNIGDKVVFLVSVDQQQFILLCKVG